MVCKSSGQQVIIFYFIVLLAGLWADCCLSHFLFPKQQVTFPQPTSAYIPQHHVAAERCDLGDVCGCRIKSITSPWIKTASLFPYYIFLSDPFSCRGSIDWGCFFFFPLPERICRSSGGTYRKSGWNFKDTRVKTQLKLTGSVRHRIQTKIRKKNQSHNFLIATAVFERKKKWVKSNPISRWLVEQVGTGSRYADYTHMYIRLRHA